MFRRLTTAADIALGAAVSGWRRVRGTTERYAEAGEQSRSRVGQRLGREAEAWRESAHESLAPVEDRIKEEMERALRTVNLVTHSEQNELLRELRQLQARLANIEAHLRRQEEEGAGADNDR